MENTKQEHDVKFLWNGIKVDGKLIKGSYNSNAASQGRGDIQPLHIAFNVDSYIEHFPKGLFNVENDSDIMRDYFENDLIRIYSNERYYGEAIEGHRQAKIHYLKQYIKTVQKRINNPQISETRRSLLEEEQALKYKELKALSTPPNAENKEALNEFAAFKSKPASSEAAPTGKSLTKQRLFVDMDGTLAVFTPTKRLETLYEKGYFENLAPMDNVVAAVKLIVHEHPEIEVNILSAHLSDSPYALAEKNAWLDKNLPELDSAHRIFMPCGTDKKDYIPQGLRETDFLLDDYTHNLSQWEPPARGIKLLNGINHTHGTWQRDRISFDRPPQELAGTIASVMEGKMQARDYAPQVTGEIETEKSNMNGLSKQLNEPQQPAEVKALEGQTTVSVLRQKGNVLQLQWNYPNGNSEYSVHDFDFDKQDLKNGNYYEPDKLKSCQEYFEERSKDIIKAAEQDFSGFSYPLQKRKVLFNRPIGNEEQAPPPPLPSQSHAPLKIERISSLTREILLQTSLVGDSQYFGYRNGRQETWGYDTLNELIEDNEQYTKSDFPAQYSAKYNVCSLYYSNGTVWRLNGDDYNVDFTKMPAEKLKEFTDDFIKKSKQVRPANKQTKQSVTETQIEIAKNTNLVAFLQGRGYDLYQSGGWYRWREHPSLFVNEDGRWAWHSQNLKGGPIDFLMKCENMNFVEAVEQLSGSASTYVPNLESKRKENVEQPKLPMKLPPADETGVRAKAYLIKTRGLDPQIVRELMADKLVYESADYHNVVFVGYDKAGTAKYAAQRGTLTAAENPFKRDILNSDKGYAFQLRGTSASKVAVFEAPIDAISHKCIQKIFGQDYSSVNRISLGGVSDKALARYLEENPQITDIAFATDNDSAGHQAAESLMQKYKALGYNVTRITPRAKDFNEDLIKIREEISAELAAEHEEESRYCEDTTEEKMGLYEL